MTLNLKWTTNLKKVNFLDVTFNLNTNTYEPYRKESDVTAYVNIRSNHPPSVLNQIPNSINARLNVNSSNKEVFYQNTDVYQRALKSSGYNEPLLFDKNRKTAKRKKETKRCGLHHHSRYKLNFFLK